MTTLWLVCVYIVIYFKCSYIAILLIYLIAIEISFTQSSYNANESTGVIQPVLNLSNPSMTDIMVEVFTTDITAFGK